MIAELRESFPTATLCRVFDVKRSSFYEWLQRLAKPQIKREELKLKVVELHSESRAAMGSRMISKGLKAQNIAAGRSLVRALMREANIVSKQRQPHPFRSRGVEAFVAPNLLKRNFKPTAVNQVWCGDVTSLMVGKRWVHLAIVIDLFARRVVGWAFSLVNDANLVSKALRMATQIRTCPPGLMFHSDQGCQYTSRKFQQELMSHGILQSMSHRGQCWDNAPTERFFGTLKSEWVPRRGYSLIDEAETDMVRFFVYYNRTRLHSYNSYLSPIAMEQKAA
ncbi:IS3 family transposase [Pseudomonas siliginis]|jgi:putative transposase|uniref:IS3 family transposase n=1 Tax=Pseudomonas siliginis TaxID=2842346 RepID=UPI00211900C5|nr:IS3 family transposase [Pseudomonas siliginis]